MNECVISIAGAKLHPLPSGALHWPDKRVLVVSDLHFGKSDRIARRTGALLPPYETRDTLARLAAELDRTAARTVICLGDSFDDLAASESLDDAEAMDLARLQAGRDWIWIEGNHDPGPLNLGGTHLTEYRIGPLVFRHIATDGSGEISGHFHPKAEIRASGRTVSRPCFLYDAARLILPAFGTYTGGLRWTDPAFRQLFVGPTFAALTGTPVRKVPVPW